MKESGSTKNENTPSHSRLSAWLCAFGLHAWKEQRTIEWNMEYITAYFEGDVCQKCGKHRCDPAKTTQGLPQNYKVLGPLST